MRISYSERDSVFGQTVLMLRTVMGLTRAELAKHLSVSRQAVSEWEAGKSYPKAEHLKELIVLGVRRQAFANGSAAEEIRTLWNAAQQKLRLDEHWLSTVLDQRASPAPRPRVDWGDVQAIPTFYGREEELALLSRWVVQERCRVVGVLGMGGIGKSALVVRFMYLLAEHFEVVIFRSLRDAPSCEALLDDCLQVLFPQIFSTVPTNLERRISLLLEHLRKTRVLLVLDNLECLLSEEDVRGRFRPGFEEYEQLLHLVVERGHQSCLLFTSREKPAPLRLLESRYSQMRSLRLAGLDVVAGQQLLEEKGVASEFTPEADTKEDAERLIEVYGGNPLALKIVAETILDLFDGKIGGFLAAEPMLVFGNITDLLDEQFARLSALEQSVLYWLTIAREPMTLDELLAFLVSPPSRTQVFEAVDSLHRRSLIERGKRLSSFALQSVVLEYVTVVLITEASCEIQQRRLVRLIQHGLSQAHAKEYVRQAQERLLVSPLLMHLQNAYQERKERRGSGLSLPAGDKGQTEGTAPTSFGAGQERRGNGLSLPTGDKGQTEGTAPTSFGVVPMVSVEEQLLSLLNQLREQEDSAQGYGPANLIALLRLLRGNLNGLDLSKLCIRSAYLQGIEMQDASLSGALIRDTVFTEPVSAAWGVAISQDGTLWAAGGMQGEVRVWGEEGRTLYLIWQAHTDVVQALAFSPNGRMLASGSIDCTVKLWDMEACGRTGDAHRGGARHDSYVWMVRQSSPQILTFSPDGDLLACSGLGTTVRVWDTQSGANLQSLEHPAHVFAIAWSPDGRFLASTCFDGQLRLWERRKTEPSNRVEILQFSTSWETSPVWNLAFAPDGRTLACADLDQKKVTLWEVESGRLLYTLEGETIKANRVAWSPDGRTLASCHSDRTIQLWDFAQRRHRATLYGHISDINSVAFTPDSNSLLSSSADGTLRVWDVQSGRCVRVMQGCAVSHYCLDWSPDGTHLVSGGTDGVVSIWDIRAETPPKELHGHTKVVWGVGWSPDGRVLASTGWDMVIRLWNPTTLSCTQIFRDPATSLQNMAWSPDGRLLAVATFLQGMYVWDVRGGRCRFVLEPDRNAFLSVVWSPDGSLLAGGDDDGNVYLWESADGTRRARLPGHHGYVMSVGWSPDGRFLASGSGNRGSGELFVWDVLTEECVQTFAGHPDRVYAVAWSPNGERLISGGGDGLLRWWDVQRGECVNMQDACHGTIRSLKVSPDGKFLASCGDDGAIRIWNLESFEHLWMLRRDRPYEQLDITGIRGLKEAQKTALQALGAIEEGQPKSKSAEALP